LWAKEVIETNIKMKNWLQKFKIGFLSLIVFLQLFAFLSPVQVYAQALPDPIKTDTEAKTIEELPVYNAGVDKSIQDYLCTPQGNGTDLFDCIDRLYRFGISAGAIMVVFFIVYAGYMYITGGEASKTKAKQTLYSAFTGLAIMLGSFVLLNFINPNLTMIKPIQPPIFSALDLPSCEEIGFNERCIISTGSAAGQVSGGPGAYNGNWKASITKYSAQYGLDPCAGDTIVKKESGSGDPNAIGHDHTVPPPVKWSKPADGKKASDSNAHDKFSASSAPKHNLDWSFSHGIGLTQVTIFPNTGGNWPDSNTPARRESELIPGGSKTVWFYPKDLLNPDFSVQITIRKLAGDLKRLGDLRAAFKAYNGGESYANDAMRLYNICKSRSG
jgi:hypothetical protein